MSPSTDIETPRKAQGVSNLTEQKQMRPAASKRRSSLRKWGPAMLTVMAVLGLNAYLLGPTGHKIPPLSAQMERRMQLSRELTARVESMNDYDKRAEAKNVRNFKNARNLSEEDGGLMEYTRRRHRALGEYVHVDVSDQFSVFGKVSVALIYFAFWVFLMVRNYTYKT